MKSEIEFSELDLDKHFGDSENYRLIELDDRFVTSVKISVNYPKRESTYCVVLSGLVNGEVDIRETKYYQNATFAEKRIFSLLKCIQDDISEKQRWQQINSFIMTALREEIKSGNFEAYLAKHNITPKKRELFFVANK